MSEDEDHSSDHGPFGSRARFASFMFELERLAASASMQEHTFAEWIEVCTMAWSTVHNREIKITVMPGDPPEQEQETRQ